MTHAEHTRHLQRMLQHPRAGRREGKWHSFWHATCPPCNKSLGVELCGSRALWPLLFAQSASKDKEGVDAELPASHSFCPGGTLRAGTKQKRAAFRDPCTPPGCRPGQSSSADPSNSPDLSGESCFGTALSSPFLPSPRLCAQRANPNKLGCAHREVGTRTRTGTWATILLFLPSQVLCH